MESLASRDRADEFEAQSKILKEKGITLLSWDSQQLFRFIRKKVEKIIEGGETAEGIRP
jgi:hypothetical protein